MFPDYLSVSYDYALSRMYKTSESENESKIFEEN